VRAAASQVPDTYKGFDVLAPRGAMGYSACPSLAGEKGLQMWYLRLRKARPIELLLGASLLFCACGDPQDRAQPGVPPDDPPGVTVPRGTVVRVTLRTEHQVDATGQGWDLVTHAVTPTAGGSDFSLLVTRIVSFLPSMQRNGICAKHPASGPIQFARLEDVPGDAESCFNWGVAPLGGYPQPTENAFVGQGYLVRGRDGVPSHKLIVVADSAIEGTGVTHVTFDITDI
jgi:hypothetical protein